MAKVLLARCIVGSRGKELSCKTSLGGCLDVLENVALGDNLGTSIGLKGVARVGVEVVVDGVEKGVAGDLGGAARGVVDVVALESDKVVATGEVQTPVMVTVSALVYLSAVWSTEQAYPSQVADQAVAPLISLFEMVTRPEAVLPRTICWRAIRSVVTWSIQMRSAVTSVRD